MTNQPLTPADIDIVEMPKLDAAINWLIGFVNGQLKNRSRSLMEGNECGVMFGYDDFVHSYKYLYYWRANIEDLAALFREEGWQVRIGEVETMFPDERQPKLIFKVGL